MEYVIRALLPVLFIAMMAGLVMITLIVWWRGATRRNRLVTGFACLAACVLCQFIPVPMRVVGSKMTAREFPVLQNKQDGSSGALDMRRVNVRAVMRSADYGWPFAVLTRSQAEWSASSEFFLANVPAGAQTVERVHLNIDAVDPEVLSGFAGFPRPGMVVTTWFPRAAAVNAIIWTLAVLVVFGVVPVVVQFARSLRRYPVGHCPRCGYDLRGNVSGVCPECGSPA